MNINSNRQYDSLNVDSRSIYWSPTNCISACNQSLLIYLDLSKCECDDDYDDDDDYDENGDGTAEL